MYQYEYNHEEAMEVRYQEGIEQGVKQGIEQGKQFERLIMIKNLFKAGTPINFIETATCMTEEQIRAVVARA